MCKIVLVVLATPWSLDDPRFLFKKFNKRNRNCLGLVLGAFGLSNRRYHIIFALLDISCKKYAQDVTIILINHKKAKVISRKVKTKNYWQNMTPMMC